MGFHCELMFASTLRRTFHVFTTTLLSLLLPLSFLLLARLSFANLTSSLYSYDQSQLVPYPLTFFFHPKNPNNIHVIIVIIVLSALHHGLTGRTPILVEQLEASDDSRSSKLHLAWGLLCTMNVAVGLGVEGSIASGIGGFPSLEPGRTLASKAFFFLGLHSTMMHWCLAVVKPVVDDTIYGATNAQRWVDKVALAGAYGGMWWWKLKNEVEAMVIVPQVKKELEMGAGMVDYVGFWLYYLVVAIGMVRVVNGLMWAATILLCRRVRDKSSAGDDEQDIV